MLYGLKKGQAKMSKSNPMSAIFMEDTLEGSQYFILLFIRTRFHSFFLNFI